MTTPVLWDLCPVCLHHFFTHEPPELTHDEMHAYHRAHKGKQ